MRCPRCCFQTPCSISIAKTQQIIPCLPRFPLLNEYSNSKIRPRAVVGYGVKTFHPSPPYYVTRSPGYSATLTHSQSRMIKITFCSLSFRSSLISLIVVSFWFILPYSVVIPPRSGIFRFIPVYSVPFLSVPVFSNARKIWRGEQRV